MLATLLALASLTIGPRALAQPAEPTDGATAAEADPSATTQRAIPAAEQQWMQSYMAGTRDAGAMWLAEGEQAFVGVYKQAVVPQPMGVLLLGNRPRDLLQPNPLQQLAGYLPLHGWSTLSVLLPGAPATLALPARSLGPGGSTPPANPAATDAGSAAADQGTSTASDTADNAQPNADAEAQQDPAAIAAQRIASGGRWLLDQGRRSLTLVSGAGTLRWAISAAIADASTTSGVVMWRVGADALELAALSELRESRVSILDVPPASLDTRALLERRQLFARAGFDSDYRAIRLPATDSGALYAQTNKRIRSWLDTTFEKY